MGLASIIFSIKRIVVDMKVYELREEKEKYKELKSGPKAWAHPMLGRSKSYY